MTLSTDEESPLQDISIQVLQEAYAELGYELQIIRTSNARSLVYANEGRTDGEVSRVRGLERNFKNLVRVPVAINVLDVRAFSNAPVIRVSTWESLRGYKLICVKGARLVELNLSALNIDCYYAMRFTQAINMLSAERGDIAVLAKVNGMQAVKALGLSNKILMGESLYKKGLYHYLNKKNADIVLQVQSALARMHERGRIKEIRSNYIKEHALFIDRF